MALTAEQVQDKILAIREKGKSLGFLCGIKPIEYLSDGVFILVSIDKEETVVCAAWYEYYIRPRKARTGPLVCECGDSHTDHTVRREVYDALP